ncbi:MAG: hypothetical protein LC650_04355 [Actinobacteria bacterium]|nr:hypothetical protein [Actinomycetota bacterium]
MKSWLILANAHDNHFGFVKYRRKFDSVQVVSLPSYAHNALLSLNCSWRWDIIVPTMISSKLSIGDNRLEWTMENLITFSKEMKVPLTAVQAAMVDYLSKFEVNGVKPITPQELAALDSLDVPRSISQALPLIEDY